MGTDIRMHALETHTVATCKSKAGRIARIVEAFISQVSLWQPIVSPQFLDECDLLNGRQPPT